MEKLCPACAQEMRKRGYSSIFVDAISKQIPSSTKEGLCDKFGGAEGFFDRCMGASFGDFHPADKEGFCAELKRTCHGKFPGEKRASFKVDEDGSWSATMPINKSQIDKRLAFGWASIVLDEQGNVVIDHDDDVIPVSELEKAAYTYVRKSRVAGENHVRKGVGQLVESVVLTKEKREAMGIPEGPVGWWVGFFITDDKVWKSIKDGELSEFSIGGRGVRERIS